jgi:hypothetical protein
MILFRKTGFHFSGSCSGPAGRASDSNCPLTDGSMQARNVASPQSG